MSLRLQLSPSPRLAAALLALHGAAAAATFAAVGGPAGAALGGLLAALGLAAAWRAALLRSPRSVRALELEGEALVVELASGERRTLPAPARCYVSRLAVALPLPRALLVTADMLGPREFRLLCLWALWRRLPPVAETQLPA